MYIHKKEAIIAWYLWYTTYYIFKKLHVIPHKIPNYLSQLDNKIGDKDFFLFNFWDELQDNTYFDDIKKDIQIKYVKLTDNTYQISIPVKIH